MKFATSVLALLPVVAAFQSPQSVSTRGASSSARHMFYPDPANTPSNPLATHEYENLAGSDRAPDCTKPAQLSTVNQGKYERLNGHNNPVSVNPANPFSSAARGRDGKDGKELDYSANAQFNPLPINPVATNQYGSVHSGIAPDCTKPPQLSTVNQGNYERLNGHNNPVTVNPSNPFSSQARGMEGKSGRNLDYSAHAPKNPVPINPLATNEYHNQLLTSGQAPDCTKPPQLSTVNQGKYERLNGHNNPVTVNPANPFSSEARGMEGKSGRALDYSSNAQFNPIPINPVATNQYDGIVHSGLAPDCTKPPQLSTVNQGNYERLNGHNNPVTVNPSNPFSSQARGMEGKSGRNLDYSAHAPKNPVPINPVATNDYSGHAPNSGQAPDCTKPPQLSTMNKGTYERLNGHNNPVSVDPLNPFSSEARGMEGKSGRALDYRPSNPIVFNPHPNPMLRQQ